ncbi:MAG: YggS family pyridoxal phosphate-dependent enzyme [Candidatus Omnitrophica bacterium]|nr:YggS family pyridoxal phosphate-dependent enzyme [Candidatus Omnitrophota bacterium]
MASLRENIQKLRKEISSVAVTSGRNPDEIRFILVSKTVSTDTIKEAYDVGERNFGENRVQEFLAKKDDLPKDIRWHFIGHLQTNKVKEIIGCTALIHSVDSLHLAKEIEKVSGKLNRITEILLQVNISHEPEKFGFKEEALEDAVSEITRFGHIKIRGLMGMGPLGSDEKKIRDSFISLRKLREKMQFSFPDLDWSELSMGMSGDYPIAVEEGATMLRIGRRVFG